MLLALLAGTLAQTPGPLPAAPGGGEPFHDELTLAKQSIWDGDYTDARSRLEGLAERLESGETPGDPIAHEALVFLGDVQFLLGEKDAARETFRSVLLIDPDHTISPYDHGEDVRALFALVREEVRRQLAALPPPPEPDPPALRVREPMSPALFAPFGIPQLHQRRRTAGVELALLQGSLAAGSLVSLIVIDRYNRVPSPGRPNLPRERVQALRYGVQWPLTFGFYATWALGVADATRRHRAAERARDEGAARPTTDVRSR